MKIGVDIDGVVFNTELLWETYAEIFDVEVLKRNSVIDRDEVRVQEKYDWTKEEFDKYMEKHLHLEDFDFVPGAKIVLDKFIKAGHEIVFITARKDDKKTRKVTLRELKNGKIKFSKIFWNETDKIQTCLNEKVDVMIDDNFHICEGLSKNKIMSLCLNSKHDRAPENKYLKYLHNWGEIYRAIYNLNQNAKGKKTPKF